jgi:DNA-binding SARP family transcriptional activator
MESRILGPREVVAGDRLVVAGGGKERALLAVLLLHANDVVPSARLIELWGESAPATVAKSVQVYISHLRPGTARRRSGERGRRAPGDSRRRVHAAPRAGQCDLDRFERLLLDDRRALEAGEPARASRSLRDALAPWRGPPLLDFSFAGAAQVLRTSGDPIVSRGNFGWQGVCPNTGPTRR